MKIKFSIKTKITASVLFVVISVLGTHAGTLFFQTQYFLNSDLEHRSERIMQRLTENLRLPLWELDKNWVYKILLTEMADEDVYAISVIGAENLNVAMMRNQEWQIVRGNPPEIIQKGFIVKQTKILRNNEEIGQLRLSLSKKLVVQQLKQGVFKNLISTAILITSIVIFLALLLKWIVIKPLHTISTAAQAVARGHYEDKLIVKGNDEISMLMRYFEHMRQNIKLREHERDGAIKALENSKNELLKLNNNLESRVIERTAALKKSNHHFQELSIAYEKAKNAAESSNRSKSIFLSNMSHELRTPMNAVLGFSRILLDDKKITTEQKESLDIINRSGSHLLNLINGILDMAKIESGRMQVEYKPFDLALLIQDVINMMHERAEKKGIDLYIDQTSSFPRAIDNDEGKLRQILVNLLSNAIKCTDTGHVILRLKTDKESLNQAVICFEVEDTGRGISKEHLPTIFTAFIQVGEQAEQTGTGLGLAITHEFVKLLEGQISVESKLGKGSIFKVYIPVVKLDEQHILSIAPKTENKIIGLLSEQDNYRILVVEDQLENRLLLHRLLESVGFQVIEAINGLEAIEKFAQYSPDFIFMDRRMPVMDGIIATKKIRGLAGGKEIPIVAVTASVFEQERSVLKEAGFNEIINKPYKDEEIFNCMEKYLDIRYLYEGNKTSNESIVKHEVNTNNIKKLPSDLINDLIFSANSLDVELTLEQIAKIEVLDPVLANSLKQLVDHFNFEKIIALVEQK